MALKLTKKRKRPRIKINCSGAFPFLNFHGFCDIIFFFFIKICFIYQKYAFIYQKYAQIYHKFVEYLIKHPCYMKYVKHAKINYKMAIFAR